MEETEGELETLTFFDLDETRKEREKYIKQIKENPGNKQNILRAIEFDVSILQFADRVILDEKDFFLKLVLTKPSALEYASKRLKDDRDVVIVAVKQAKDCLRWASIRLRKDKEIVREVLKQDGMFLRNCRDEFKNDLGMVFFAVSQAGRAFQYCSQALKRDPNVVLEAVKQDGNVLELVGVDFRKDKKVVLEAVRQNGVSLAFASHELRNDEEVVIAAITKNGSALEFANKRFWNDPVFVKIAVTTDGEILRICNDDIRNDKDIVFLAVNQNEKSLRFASQTIRNSFKDIVLQAVEKNGLILGVCGEKFRKDREIVLAAVRSNGLALRFSDKEYQDDREIALIAVKKSGGAIAYVSNRLKSDKEVVELAVKQNGGSFVFLNEEMKLDEIRLLAIRENGNILEYFDEKLRGDLDFVMTAVRRNGNALQFASEELRNNRDVVGSAIISDAISIQFVGRSLLDESLLIKLLHRHKGDVEHTVEEFSRITREKEEEREKWDRDWIDFGSKLDMSKNQSLTRKFRISSNYDIESSRKQVEYFKEELSGANISDLNINSHLGSGAFARVYSTTLKGIYGFFALKVYSDLYQSKERQEEMLQQDLIPLTLPYDITILPIFSVLKRNKVNLERFPDYEDFWKRRGMVGKKRKLKTSMVLMKRHRQTLNMMLRSGKVFDSLEICNLVHGVAKGVVFLHINKIVHRDLHFGNLFVDPEICRITIGDFGVGLDLRNNITGFKVHRDSKLLYDQNNYTAFQSFVRGGAIQFLPPEVMNFDPSKHEFIDYEKSDLYGVGCMLQRLCGLIEDIKFDVVDYFIISRFLLPLTKKILQEDPMKRIGHEQVVVEVEQILERWRSLLEFNSKKRILEEKNTRQQQQLQKSKKSKKKKKIIINTDNDSNREFLLNLIEKDPRYFADARQDLKESISFINEAIKRNGSVLDFLPQILRDDVEIVRSCVNQNGNSLAFANDQQNDTKDIVLSAVRNKGCAFFFASQRLQSDKDIVFEAIKKDGMVLEYVDMKYREDKDFVLKIAKENGKILQYAIDEHKNDLDIVIASFLNDRSAFSFIGNEAIEKLKFPLFEVLKRFNGDVERSLDYFAKECLKSFTTGRNEFPRDYQEMIFNKLKKKPPTISEYGYFSKPVINETEEREEIKEIRKELEKIRFKNLSIHRRIGGGIQGDVYLCSAKDGFGLLVVKHFLKTVVMVDGLSDETLDRETVSKDLFHPNVVTVLSHLPNEEIDLSLLPESDDIGVIKTGIVFMKYYRKDLKKYIKYRKNITKRGNKRFENIEIARILEGLVHGAYHLHQKKIIHRDLHPGNVFIDEELGRIWIGDFGCALDLTDNPDGYKVHKSNSGLFQLVSYLTGFGSFTGTLKDFNKGGANPYLPPEIREFDPSKQDYLDYSKSDLFSIGVIGKKLLGKKNTDDLETDVETNLIEGFVDEMTQFKIEKRISFDDAVRKISQIRRFVEINVRDDSS